MYEQEKFTSIEEEIDRVRREARVFQEIDNAPLDDFIKRCGDSKVVLLGESTHGTSEFYRMRARITQELVKRCGFNIVAIEWDFPDVEAVDRYIRHFPKESYQKKIFTRFPEWMWKNKEFLPFVDWLRAHNGESARSLSLYGIDLYCIDRSIEASLEILEKRNPSRAEKARQLYSGLYSRGKDAAQYGAAVKRGECRSYREEAAAILQETIGASSEFQPEEFFHLIQNMRLVLRAEESARALAEPGSPSHWNLRDRHMFETLEALLEYHGKDSKAIVWAHNSHLGNAPATQMPEGGLLNVGQLCRERFQEGAYLVGFGFYQGTVACAPYWGAPMQVREVQPAHPESYESLFHKTGHPSFFLPLREKDQIETRQTLLTPRLQRGIGSVSPPQQPEGYQKVCLPLQFDEYVWFDRTCAIHPI